MRRFLCPLFLIAVFVACSPIKQTEPSQRVNLGDERGRYSFDTPDTSWDAFSLGGDQALFRVHGGVLEGAVIADRGYIWSLSNIRHNDGAISVVVRQTKGSRGNGFGVMCRANEQGDGYYFVISSAGQFAILKAQTGVSDPLRLVNWQSSPAIFQGDESNKIEAICAGDYLSFSAMARFWRMCAIANFRAVSWEWCWVLLKRRCGSVLMTLSCARQPRSVDKKTAGS